MTSPISYPLYIADSSTGSKSLAVQTPEPHLVQALRRGCLISPLQSVRFNAAPDRPHKPALLFGQAFSSVSHKQPHNTGSAKHRLGDVHIVLTVDQLVVIFHYEVELERSVESRRWRAARLCATARELPLRERHYISANCSHTVVNLRPLLRCKDRCGLGLCSTLRL